MKTVRGKWVRAGNGNSLAQFMRSRWRLFCRGTYNVGNNLRKRKKRAAAKAERQP